MLIQIRETIQVRICMSIQSVTVPIVPNNIYCLNHLFGKFVILKEFGRIWNQNEGRGVSINTSNIWNSVPVLEDFCNSYLSIHGTFLFLPRRILGVPWDVGA